jgi:UDP-N-acetylglucosamine--N-acetylmuramyl-(pentapeptide) pyrophosphoryl-undecaprenol N-acetylglucosamine transferase
MTHILFAGGGTAGHIEPALAVAREWQKKFPDSEITFVGTASGLETRLVPEAGFALKFIPKVSVPRRLSPGLATLPFSLLRAIAVSLRLTASVDVVVGFGGYVCAPIYLAAVLTRTPIVIHEANATPGLANRLGARFTRYCAITYPISRGPLRHAEITGLPLRPDISHSYRTASADWKRARAQAKEKLGFSSHDPLLFIFGGSQGSQAINSVIADARGALEERGINIYHGIGSRNELPVNSPRYQAASYITDMAAAYLAADVVISRSGAVTCSEVNALGRYALFIPLPIGNGEQERNASTLIAQNRAELCAQSAFTNQWLVAQIDRLLERSVSAPLAGSDSDLQAATKIVGVIEKSLSGGR